MKRKSFINFKFSNDFTQFEQSLNSKHARINGQLVNCQHDFCCYCKGTGMKDNGQVCIHNIVCNCRRCALYCDYINEK